MIFMTVGTIMPFDRLTRALDTWAAAHKAANGDMEIFGQVGDVGEKNDLPQHFPWERRLSNAEFKERIRNCDVVVAHAGIGTIIESLQLSKPIVVMAREHRWKEHVNDHQLQTINRFQTRPGIHAVLNEAEFGATLDRALAQTSQVQHGIHPHAEESLISALRQTIHKV